MSKKNELIEYINNELCIDDVTQHPELKDFIVKKVYEDIIKIIDPPSIIKIYNGNFIDGFDGIEYTFDTESELWDWYQRMKKLSSDMDVKTFYEIIHLPDFTIDGYEISKRISIETEKDLDKKHLQKRYNELMED